MDEYLGVAMHFAINVSEWLMRRGMDAWPPPLGSCPDVWPWHLANFTKAGVYRV
jgi:hypothetical protein